MRISAKSPLWSRTARVLASVSGPADARIPRRTHSSKRTHFIHLHQRPADTRIPRRTHSSKRGHIRYLRSVLASLKRKRQNGKDIKDTRYLGEHILVREHILAREHIS